MVSYTYALGDHAVGWEYMFEPQSPQITWNGTGQPHSFTGTIDAFCEAALHLQELVQDAWIWRADTGGKQLVFRGPLLKPSDALGADRHTITLNCESYRTRLTRLNTNLIPNDPQTGQYVLGSGSGPSLAWDLIAHHIAGTDLANILTNAWAGTGAHITNAAVATGTDLASAIDSLAQTAGFDWDLVPKDDGTVQFQAWTPARGIARPDLALQYIRDARGLVVDGSNCTGSRDVDPSQFGNRVYVIGQDVNGNQLIGYAGTSPGPAGSYTIVASGSDLTGSAPASSGADTQALLNQRAATLLAQAQAVTAGYTLSPVEGWWPGPDLLNIGDQPTAVIHSGRLRINEPLPVTQIVAAPGDGAENLQVSLARPPAGKNGELAVARGFTNIARRLRNSEWRS